MNSAPDSGHVILMHGLYPAGTDPFMDLLQLENAIQSAGYVSHRVAWPEGYNPLLALGQRHRSFADEIAQTLDAELRGKLLDVVQTGRWALCGHSGGGLAIYRWLTVYAQRLAAGRTPLPRFVITLAAPYQCELHWIQFNGRRLTVNEDPIDPAAIAQATPGRLLVCVAGNEDVLAPTDVAFPPEALIREKIYQELIPDVSHKEVCNNRLTHQLVRSFLGRL